MRHERRWASDSVPAKGALSSSGTSPGTESTTGAEEFVEVTLDLQDDDTIILRSVEPAPGTTTPSSAVINVFDDGGLSSAGGETPTPTSASASRSPTMKRSSSNNRLRQFSQELKAEAVAKAKQFSQELMAELRRFSWSHGHAARILSSSPSSQNNESMQD